MLSHKQFAFASALSAFSILSVAAGAVEVNKNRVAIIVDSSGSFLTQAPAAVQQAIAILDQYAERKERRSERRNSDEIAIIALDASPEMIFSGTREDLKKLDRSAWVARFNARKTFGMCTDVVAAFDLAVRFLSKEPQVIGHYIFGYSDLIDEPHAGFDPNGRPKCKPAHNEPAENFPWAALRQLQVQMHLLWLPTNQVLRWKQAIQDQGLGDLVLTYSDAETPTVEMGPPSVAHAEPPTDAETKAIVDKAKDIAGTAGVWVAYGLGTLVGGAIALALFGGITRWIARIVRSLRGRNAVSPSTPQSRNMLSPPRPRPRPVTGPVPPLSLNQR